MQFITTQQSIGIATIPGLNLFYFQTKLPDPEWTNLYSVSRSDKAKEVDVHFAGPLMASPKQETGALTTGGFSQFGEPIIYEMGTFGIAIPITLEAEQDNLYKDVFPKVALTGKNGIQLREDVEGANMFNQAVNNRFPMYDGLPLFAPQRPVANGMITGNGSPNGVALNEAALEAMIVCSQNLLNDSGQPMPVRIEKLVTSTQTIQFDADRLLNSRYQAMTNNNAINSVYNKGSIAGGYFSYRYLTNPDQWFGITDIGKRAGEHRGNRYFLRTEVFSRDLTDPTSMITTYGFVKRFAFGCSDWRANIGSF